MDRNHSGCVTQGPRARLNRSLSQTVTPVVDCVENPFRPHHTRFNSLNPPSIVAYVLTTSNPVEQVKLDRPFDFSGFRFRPQFATTTEKYFSRPPTLFSTMYIRWSTTNDTLYKTKKKKKLDDIFPLNSVDDFSRFEKKLTTIVAWKWATTKSSRRLTINSC